MTRPQSRFALWLRTCLLLLCVLPGAAVAEVRQLSLKTNDLIYEPVSQKLYASVPSSAGAMGNSVAVIDPVAGSIGPFLFVGSEPGKLAVSDDGQYLYVALDGAAAVRRVDLKQWKAELQFPLGSDQFSGPYYVEDLQVMAGSPRVVAVARRNIGFSPRHEGVAIYDDGVQRPKETPGHTGSNTLAFGATGSRLYGFNTESTESGFRRMAVDAMGVTVLDATPVPGLGGVIRYADGRLYGSSGRLIDPESRQLLGTFAVSSFPSAMAVDPKPGRVFFLTGMDPGMARKLLAFDALSFLSTGTLDLSGVMGRASSLVLWGTDGLAFRTDAGQVFLIRTPLRQAETATADLALAVTAAPEPATQGADLTLTTTVENRGPSAATGVTVRHRLPLPLTDEIVSITSSQGRCERVNNEITCMLGALASGDRATVTLVVRPGATQPERISSWEVEASVSAAEPDPNSDNNGVTKIVSVRPRGSGDPGSPAGSAPVRQISLAVKDLVYDPVSRKIYASVPASAGAGGNSVTAVDPASGAIGSPIFVGSEPGRLALSDDGRYLYVALDGAAAVRQVDLPMGRAGLQFPLGNSPIAGTLFARDLEVMPGNPEVVAVARRGAGVAIYDKGVPRGRQHTGPFDVSVIEFGASPARLYGYNLESTEFGFRRLMVDAAGVSEVDVTRNLISGFNVDIEFDGGLVFSTNGRAIDPERRTIVGTFTGVGFGLGVAPDHAAGQVYFLIEEGSAHKLLAFDSRTFLPLGALEISGVTGKTSRLIRWEGGVAFGTDAGQLYLIRTPLAAQVELTLSLSPSQVVGGSPVTGTVALSAPASEDAVVTLFTSDRSVAEPVPTVVVRRGESRATFAITTRPVTGRALVEIAASYAGVTREASLSVLPPPPRPKVVSLVLEPNPVDGGKSVEATVTLSGPAPADGRGVGLGKADPTGVLSMPSQLLVRPGATTARFTIGTRAVTRRTRILLWAAAGEVVTAELEVLPVPATPPSGPESVRQLTLPTNDLVYDRVTKKIYASGRNSVTSLDPVTGTIGTPVFVGSEPGKLALSDDGQYLYVALDGGDGMVRRFDMATQTAGLQFALGRDPFFGPYHVEDMEVLAGSPNTVAISRRFLAVSPRHAGVAIYENGGLRGQATERHTGSNVIERSASRSVLYGYNNETTEFGFRRMAVDGSEVRVVDVKADLVTGFDVDIKFDERFIFTTAGQMIDPERGLLVRTFPIFGSTALVAPDVKAGLVFYLTGEGPTRKLQAYDWRTGALTDAIDVPGVQGRASRLIRWGEDGLAFNTSQRQVFLIRAPVLNARGLTLSFGTKTVIGGTPIGGLVMLPPQSSGGEVTFSSSNPSVAVPPAPLRLGPGIGGSSFEFATRRVTAATDVVISATYAGRTARATLRVLPSGGQVPVASLVVAPPQVVGGETAVGTVTLAAPAPPEGRGVGLGTHIPSLVSLPPSVWVPAGERTARFTMATRPVTKAQQVLIWAVGGEVRTATLLLLPPTAQPAFSLVLDPPTVPGGGTVTGKIILTGAASAVGAAIPLTNGNPSAATIPAQVTLPAGATTVAFTVGTRVVTAPTDVPISATYKGVTLTATLRVLPGPALSSLNLTSEPVFSGSPLGSSVSLAGPAPVAGAEVSLSSSNPAVATVPASVRVPANATIAGFQITTFPVASLTEVVISAAHGGVTRTGTLRMRPQPPVPAVTSFGVNQSPVAGGRGVEGHVQISAPAPKGGRAVRLESTDPALVLLPPEVVVPEGEDRVHFLIRTRPVNQLTRVLLRATGGEVAQRELNLLPPDTSGTLQVLSLGMGGGEREGEITGGVILTDTPVTTTVVVMLASSHPAVVAVPPYMVVQNGVNGGSFPISIQAVTEPTQVVISATARGVVHTVTLRVGPGGVLSVMSGGTPPAP